jgi:glucosamine--fructose-6-phosphate aminotransferase (isomerizing)
MTEIAFDPERPLPGPPEPWAATDTPSGRAGPPFHMTEMIAAEPALARRVLGRLAPPNGAAAALAAAIVATVRGGRPVVVTGCGTSEHGAVGFADIVGEALAAVGMRSDGVVADQAFELALDPPSGGLVIGISHEGGTWATNQALEAARSAGCEVAVVTASDRSPAAALARTVVTTEEVDQSWCHTIGYLSPLLVGAAVAGFIASDQQPDARVIEGLLRPTDSQIAAIESAAAALGPRRHVIVLGSGADRIAGRELTLKIEEGAWIPSAYRDLETFLHGHLPATGEQTALVLLATDRRAGTARLDRARQALAAAAEIGVASAVIATDVARQALADHSSAGFIAVDEAASLPPAQASLFATTAPLQLLTERISRVRGTNPDPIRRDDDRYAAAAARVEG